MCKKATRASTYEICRVLLVLPVALLVVLPRTACCTVCGGGVVVL